MQFYNSVKVLFGLLVLILIISAIETSPRPSLSRSKKSIFPPIILGKMIEHLIEENNNASHIILKRSLMTGPYIARLITSAVPPVGNSPPKENASEITAVPTHRSKRSPMSSLILNTRRLSSSVGIATTAGIASTVSITAMDKIQFVYDAMKSKIQELAGITNKTSGRYPPKIVPSRGIPDFSYRLGRSMRNKRDVGINEYKGQNISEQNLSNNRSRRFAYIPILIQIAKMGGVAGTVIVAGTATSFIDSAIKEKYAKDAEERLIRRSIDCSQNNFGCIENLCWTNCGPRLSSADWCITTDGTKGINNTVQVAKCEKDGDCNKCWPCATSCKMEGMTTFVPTQTNAP